MNMMGNFQNVMEEAKAKLDDITIEEQTEGIKVTVTASSKITNISIDPSLIADQDGEQIEDLLMSTLNRALTKAKETETKEMEKVTNSMIPGGLGGLKGMFS